MSSATIITAPGANTAFFPLDDRWQLTHGAYSAGCAQQMVWLSGLFTYGECQAVFERIGKRHIPASSIWRQTQATGARLQQQMEHEQRLVGVERTVVPPATLDHAQPKGISMDGGMVNIRGEGWKEFKVGTVFDVELRLERDKRTAEFVERAHGVPYGVHRRIGVCGPFRSRSMGARGTPRCSDCLRFQCQGRWRGLDLDPGR